MAVTGKTGLYLVIGDPVAQTKSPALYTGWCEAQGVDAIFMPFRISRDQASQVFGALRHVPNLRGMIVTIPFKPLVAEFCDSLTQRAQGSGAVNVIRVSDEGAWHGDALDGFGCVDALGSRGLNPAGARIRICGAGGAGASVAAALAEAKAAEISLFDMDQERAANLAARLERCFPGVRASAGHPAPDRFDIVVNASPAGMRPDDPLPIGPDLLNMQPVLIEMIMQPERTRLIALAEQQGCQVVPGLEVLEGQFGETLRFLGLSHRQTDASVERRDI